MEWQIHQEPWKGEISPTCQGCHVPKLRRWGLVISWPAIEWPRKSGVRTEPHTKGIGKRGKYIFLRGIFLIFPIVQNDDVMFLNDVWLQSFALWQNSWWCTSPPPALLSGPLEEEVLNLVWKGRVGHQRWTSKGFPKTQKFGVKKPEIWLAEGPELLVHKPQFGYYHVFR